MVGGKRSEQERGQSLVNETTAPRECTSEGDRYKKNKKNRGQA